MDSSYWNPHDVSKRVHIGRVWIELIFAETENWNWKHFSEIIFKCVNSAVESIFNKKVAEKCNLWDHKQCTDALFTVDKVNYCSWTKKKKKEKNAAPKRRRRNNLDPNGHIILYMKFLLTYFLPWEYACYK